MRVSREPVLGLVTDTDVENALCMSRIAKEYAWNNGYTSYADCALTVEANAAYANVYVQWTNQEAEAENTLIDWFWLELTRLD